MFSLAKTIYQFFIFFMDATKTFPPKEGQIWTLKLNRPTNSRFQHFLNNVNYVNCLEVIKYAGFFCCFGTLLFKPDQQNIKHKLTIL